MILSHGYGQCEVKRVVQIVAMYTWHENIRSSRASVQVIKGGNKAHLVTITNYVLNEIDTTRHQMLYDLTQLGCL